jgi:phosphatidylserine/phosphatidylglycerophosphate/cardiolipin synthase-like enzyme
MFRLFKNNAADQESYSGSSSYRYINSLIRKGSELYIVSPYIDNYYATVIRDLSSSRRFRIISSSIDERAKSILTHNVPKSKLALYFLMSLLVSYATYFLLHTLLYPAVIMLMFVIYAAIVRLTTGNRNVYLKIPNRFVHAKMYISEDQAITGSANLTYKGTHVNVEHIEIIRDRRRVDELRKDFLRLWNS